jgi:hypothetical protein
MPGGKTDVRLLSHAMAGILFVLVPDSEKASGRDAVNFGVARSRGAARLMEAGRETQSMGTDTGVKCDTST